MDIVSSSEALRAQADRDRAAGLRLALVPTMGALHEGHLSLIGEARKRADRVWVSIFVNPTQFNDPSDFEIYPRDHEADLAACRDAGVDLVFLPTVEDLYPEGAQSWVEVESLSQPLCGASRPGHFRGVTTIVTKLFLAAKPHVAVFGEKDFQQLAILRRMVRDLGFGIEVVGGATVREPDGVALSSRNRNLGPVARKQARSLVRALDAAEHAVVDGERRRDVILDEMRAVIGAADQAELDYAELRCPETLALAAEEIEGHTLLALAVHFRPDADGQGAAVRLIDNRVLYAP